MFESCFRKSGYAIDQYVYLDECLEPYLMSFIENYHKEDKYVFWPDLASAHYAFLFRDWLNSKKTPFLPKISIQQTCQKSIQLKFFGVFLKLTYMKTIGLQKLLID